MPEVRWRSVAVALREVRPRRAPVVDCLNDEYERAPPLASCRAGVLARGPQPRGQAVLCILGKRGNRIVNDSAEECDDDGNP